MMEYVGLYKKDIYSDIFKEYVSILKYEDHDKRVVPYMTCNRCGKDIKRKMYVVQSNETDVELMYLGSECINHFA